MLGINIRRVLSKEVTSGAPLNALATEFVSE